MERKIKIQDLTKKVEMTKEEMRTVYGGGTPILPRPGSSLIGGTPISPRPATVPIPIPRPLALPIPVP